jgi:lipopolysaccharide/colanic/teichoic acid biosynthesis glycosyltransferase
MSDKVQKTTLIFTLLVVDTLAILAGWALAFFLRIASDIIPYESVADPHVYAQALIGSLPLWWLGFALNHLYDRDEILGGPREYGNVAKGCGFGFVALMGMSIFLKTADLSRGWLVAGLLISTVLVGIGRFTIRRFIYRLWRRGWYIRRALIVGTSDSARAIARQLAPATTSGVEVVGFVDDFLPLGTQVTEGLSVHGAPHMLSSLVKQFHVDDVILIPGSMSWESFQELLRRVSLSPDGYSIRLSPGFYEVLTTGVRVSYKNHIPLLAIERAQITGIDALLKNTVDYGLGGLMLLCSMPLMIGIACALKVVSRRPILDKTLVFGRNGKPFYTWRFRSVALPSHPADKTEGERSLAHLLYQSGLDKLPQVFNVLRGQMSLVGPRPVPVPEASGYERWLPNLLTLKPGMTGPRVAAKQPEITLEEEMRLDLYYARNYSIWLDLLIVFQTVPRMMRRERILRKPLSAQPAVEPVQEPWPRSSALSALGSK